MMETPFYEDPNYHAREDIRMLKRNMTLDFSSSPRPNKRQQRMNSVLTSPDMHMLKLESPELERMIIAQNGMVTTTPTPTQCLFPKTLTHEQEQYARGFVDALAQLHQTSVPNGGNVLPPSMPAENLHQETIVPTTSSINVVSARQPPPSSCAVISCHPQPPHVTLTHHGQYQQQQQPPVANVCVTTAALPHTMNSVSVTSAVGYHPAPPPPMANGYHHLQPMSAIKDEPQTVPTLGVTPPLSPIDMEDQERIKLERKRLRNRIAASKCRRRKLERIARLEDKVQLLKNENSELVGVVTKLREQVCHLKQQVIDHATSGCQIMLTTDY